MSSEKIGLKAVIVEKFKVKIPKNGYFMECIEQLYLQHKPKPFPLSNCRANKV